MIPVLLAGLQSRRLLLTAGLCTVISTRFIFNVGSESMFATKPFMEWLRRMKEAIINE